MSQGGGRTCLISLRKHSSGWNREVADHTVASKIDVIH